MENEPLKSNRLRNFFSSLIFGGSVALSFSPFFVIPIFFMSCGWLYYRIWKCSSLKNVFIDSLTFFTAFFIALLYWLVQPLTFDLKQYAILLPFASLLIPMFLGIQFASVIWLAKKYFWNNTLCRISSFSIGLLAITFFCGEIFPNFPWMLPGYICCGHEIFMQTISIYGIYGLSYVILFTSALFGELFINLRMKNRLTIISFTCVICTIFFSITSYGYYRLKKYPTQFTNLSAQLVQCSISQEDKENRSLAYENLQKHISRSWHDEHIDFVIWPEAAIPYLYHENFQDLHRELTRTLYKNEILITGVVRRDLKTSLYYNSIVAINDIGQNIAIYDKSKLVPFGEYVPCRKLLSVSPLAATIEDFAIGTTPKIHKLKGLNILFSDCYEAIFRYDCKNADVMVNLTNDGWFGYTTELFQHLAIVRARSVELGIPVIRVTNFGITALFDPCGRCLIKIPVGTASSVKIKIPKRL